MQIPLINENVDNNQMSDSNLSKSNSNLLSDSIESHLGDKGI